MFFKLDCGALSVPGATVSCAGTTDYSATCDATCDGTHFASGSLPALPSHVEVTVRGAERSNALLALCAAPAQRSSQHAPVRRTARADARMGTRLSTPPITHARRARPSTTPTPPPAPAMATSASPGRTAPPAKGGWRAAAAASQTSSARPAAVTWTAAGTPRTTSASAAITSTVALAAA